MKNEHAEKVNLRRTFGIISHPDAGKTTLTEKLLLFGGAIKMAGAIKAKKNNRYATSDWMSIEKERGISVTTSVMKFNYNKYELNLLDTPGHEDFSEDTYRVLTAVDSALMVIDNSKGVEKQTKKLMEVCRMRNTPIITFINKLDRDGILPLDIISEIESKLQIECAPILWPIGMGKLFQGMYSIYKKQIQFFTDKSTIPLPEITNTILADRLGQNTGKQLYEEITLIEGASNPFELNKYLTGKQTPVFFGSAVNNFGIRELLDAFIEIAPPPKSRETTTRIISPYEKSFTGFTFKIQANMNPSHRDRIAFIRICSGKFKKGIKVLQTRTNKQIILSKATTFMAKNRSNIEEAYPGDVIGIHNHGTIKVGDSFSEKEIIKFTGIPIFAPEYFKQVKLKDPMKTKQLNKGLKQLTEEGSIQFFKPLVGNNYILGAVGILQFSITMARLKSEYGVKANSESINLVTARWISSNCKIRLRAFEKDEYNNLATDAQGHLAYLATSLWRLENTIKKWKKINFLKTREHD